MIEREKGKKTILTAASPRDQSPLGLVPLHEVLVATEQAQEQVRDEVLRQRERGDDAKGDEQERRHWGDRTMNILQKKTKSRTALELLRSRSLARHELLGNNERARLKDRMSETEGEQSAFGIQIQVWFFFFAL